VVTCWLGGLSVFWFRHRTPNQAASRPQSAQFKSILHLSYGIAVKMLIMAHFLP
jgi:hypothetical protein